jgi:hypothetical protein
MLERDTVSTAKRITLLIRYVEKRFREPFRLVANRPAGKPEKAGINWFEQLLLCTCFGLTAFLE